MDTARMQEADSLLREAVEVLRAVYPTGHPSLAFALRFHGQMQTRLGRPEDAIQPLREAIAMWRESVGADAIPVANTESDLTLALNRLGQFQEAERVGRDAIRIDAKLLGERSAMVYQAQTYVAGALIGQQRFAEAESLLVGAYVRFEHPNLVTAAWRRDALLGLVRLYDAEHKPAEAARYRALLAEPVATANPTAHR
jgi:tetratricopeptide (TPR) repeat protein